MTALIIDTQTNVLIKVTIGPFCAHSTLVENQQILSPGRSCLCECDHSTHRQGQLMLIITSNLIARDLSPPHNNRNIYQRASILSIFLSWLACRFQAETSQRTKNWGHRASRDQQAIHKSEARSSSQSLRLRILP